MARFRYNCEQCNEFRFFYSDSEMEESKLERKCKVCSGLVSRAPTGPTSFAKEKMDNGLMIDKVEQFVDKEIYKQHSSFEPKKD